MKKIILSLFTVFFFAAAIQAQQNTVYAVVISFNSECCGVPSDAPLIKFIAGFKKQYRIRSISADNIGPMGREGEYYLAFGLKELNKAQKLKFIQLLKTIVPTLKDKGSATLTEAMPVDKTALGRAAISPRKL